MLGSSQPLNDQKLQGKGIKSPQTINSVFTAAIPEMWVHCSECKSSAGPALTSSLEPWDTVTPVLNPWVSEGETCQPWSLLVAPVLLCPAVHSLLATRHHALCAFFKMTKHAQCSSQPPFSHGDSAALCRSAITGTKKLSTAVANKFYPKGWDIFGCCWLLPPHLQSLCPACSDAGGQNQRRHRLILQHMPGTRCSNKCC